jgi:hypothetical protein
VHGHRGGHLAPPRRNRFRCNRSHHESHAAPRWPDGPLPLGLFTPYDYLGSRATTREQSFFKLGFWGEALSPRPQTFRSR